MKRGRSNGKPTAAQQQRMDVITEIGCIVAYSLGIDLGDRPIPAEVHHLTVGGKHGAKRRGHDFTIGLNPWSHRGEPFGGMSAARCEELLGPSYARPPRKFRQEADRQGSCDTDGLLPVFRFDESVLKGMRDAD